MSKPFLGSTLMALLLGLAPPLHAEPITVRGRVFGPEDRPISGADVTLTTIESALERGRRWLAEEADPPALASARTDAAGSFRIEIAAPVFALLTVRAPGFAALELPLEPLLESSELPTARLARSRELMVRVTAAGGKPWAGAWIAASSLATGASFFDGGWQSARRRGRAGADGTLRLERGEDERVLVRAIAPGSSEVEQEVVQGAALALELPAAVPMAIQIRGPQGKPVLGAVLFGGKGLWPLGRTDAAGMVAVAATLADTTVQAHAADGASLGTRLPRANAAGLPIALELSPPTVIAGRVVEASTRRPLAGALVWPQDAGERAAKTGGDGRYELRLLGANGWVQAVAPGFLAASERVGSGGRGPTLGLSPALAVRGTIVDEGGQPIAGAEIEARVNLASQMGRRFFGRSQPRRARTLGDGHFELRGLQSGPAYELRATRADYAPAAIDLPPAAGANPWPPQRLVLSRGVSAYGRVLDGRRQPVVGAVVELVAAPAEQSFPGMRMARADANDPDFLATSGSDGRFEIGHVPAGRYDLEAMARGFAPLTVPGLELAATAPRRDLGTIVVGPGAVLEGVTVDEAGQPVADAQVWANATGSGAMMPRFWGAEDEPQAVTAADGRFRIEDLRPGESVDVTALRRGYARGTAAGVEPPVTEPLRIVLAPSLKLSGRVLAADGKGIAGATVSYTGKLVLGTQRRFSSGRSGAVSDADGRFTLEGLEPGQVMLYASAPGFVTAHRADLQVTAGREVVGVELTLLPAARIVGQVLDAAGEPASAVAVEIHDDPEAFMRRPVGTTSDGDGFYSLDGVETGPRTVVARDEEGRRAAVELEVQPGDNVLNLRLAGGVAVSGVVRNNEGLPVGGATVALGARGRFWRSRQASTLTDGSFVLADVSDGAYQLTAERKGFAPAQVSVEVGGAPISGLELRLELGAAIVGQVRGLEFADLPRVQLYAWSEGHGPRPGSVDFQGRYRIPSLATGTWMVAAEVEGSGRSASGRVEIVEGQLETPLDLEFGHGWVLSGRVLSGGQPLAGAVVGVLGREVGRHGEAPTGQAGEFKIQDLESGVYDLTVHRPASGFAHRQELVLSGDQEIEVAIATGEVRGIVLDSLDRTPITGASVSLEPTAGSESFLRFGNERGTETDSRGVFRLSEVAAGDWTITAKRVGYARTERSVTVSSAADVEELELQLQPTEGVSLEVHDSGGRVPEMIFVTVGDGAGLTVAAGTYNPVDTGRVRLRDVPAGSWEVLLSAPGSAVAQAQVVAPGPSVPVVLSPAATLEIVVTELAESELLARATLVSATGRPFRVPDWGGGLQSEWLLRGGRAQVQNLSAGAWTVTVVAPDGRTWSGTASVKAGEATELRLESTNEARTAAELDRAGTSWEGERW